MKIRGLFLAVALMVSSIASAVTLKSTAPEVYTVKAGDTLWSISQMYLHEPWKWRELWSNNKQIRNPHRIYPGDQIQIINGKITLKRFGNPDLRSTRLTPELREEPIDSGIETVSFEQLQGALIDMTVVDKDEIKHLPYVVATENQRIMGGKNDRTYINKELSLGKVYNTYRIEQTYKAKRDSKNREVELGTLLTKTGEVRIERNKDGLSTARIVKIHDRGIRDGHYLIEKDKVRPNFYFEPKEAPHGTEATILAMPKALYSQAKGGLVILDRGIDAGLSLGSVLLANSPAIYRRDPHTNQKIEIPGEAAGIVMVYKVFDQLSLGIIMEANDRIKVGYPVLSPHTGYGY